MKKESTASDDLFDLLFVAQDIDGQNVVQMNTELSLCPQAAKAQYIDQAKDFSTGPSKTSDCCNCCSQSMLICSCMIMRPYCEFNALVQLAYIRDFLFTKSGLAAG